MDTKFMMDLQNRIITIEDTVAKLENILSGYNIDKQYYIKSNGKIKPGIGTKISFNDDGLVINKDILSYSDIPELDIDKIKGLRRLLSDKANKSDLENLSINYDKIFEDRPVVNTGIKISYDKYGVIQHSSELQIEDLPKITINDVEGLKEQIDLLNVKNQYVDREDIVKISPNTSCKVTYNENGIIVEGSKLSTEDIPEELIQRINEVDNKVDEKLYTQDFQNFQQSILSEIEKINNRLTDIEKIINK